MPITFEPVPEWLQDDLQDLVGKVLRNLYIRKTMDGFSYLSYAIAETIQNPCSTAYITKELYPEIAKRYNTTASCVERAMRTAIKRCWDSKGRETLEEMVGHLNQRPTNSEFISLLAAYIRRRE